MGRLDREVLEMILTTLVLGATLTLADLRRLVNVGQPQISPDGTRVVVQISKRDFDKDRMNGDLVVIDVRTHAQRKLLRDVRLSGYDWSPDGASIAYISVPTSGDDKSPQLFMLPMDGGEPLQLTHEKNGVDDFAWRPDSKMLAYSAEPEAANQTALDHGENAFNVTEEAWTEQSPTATHELYEISASGGKARRIGDGSVKTAGGFTYAADGQSLFVTRLPAGAEPNQYLASEIVNIRVSDGRVTVLPQLSKTQGDPIRSFDGTHLAFDFTNPHGSMQSEIAVASASGADPKWVSQSLDRNVGAFAFMPGNSLVVAANDHTQRRLFYLINGTHLNVPIGDLQVGSAPSVARNGTIAFVAATENRPSNLYVLRPHDKAPQRLTDENAWLANYAIPRSETINWKTADGMTADGVLIYPVNWHAGQAKAPLVLFIHGGPTAQSVTSFNGFAYVLASHGWFVFEPNYRGSDGLGLQFARTTVPHITSVPGDDIERGLDAVLKLGVVDPSRMAVSGWSEGGLMTSWLITHDTRWKAAVSGAAVNDWIQYGAMTDAKSFTPQFIGSNPWNDPSLLSLYKSESPLTYADRVKTPTLILSDAGDYRVPTPLAYEFYHAVRATGTPVKFVIWPVNGHFPSDPVRSEDVSRQWEAWLVTYLK
jgi:dipeptidyl aminopeptidase/acylaminoacyl peptidase